MSVNEKMTAIADEIRLRTKLTDKLTLDQMPIDIASLPSELGDVPTYVETEAQRVADIVAGLQNENTVSFIAMSDTHVAMNNAQNIASTTHVMQGAKLVSKKVPVDFAIMLGDLVSGAKTDSLEQHLTNLIGMLRNSSKLCPIRMCGNHDNNVYNLQSYILADELYKYAGRFNKDVTKPEEEFERNYFYFDLEDKKLRVICLNTGDMNDIATDKLGDGCWIGEHQFNWLIDTLDMTGKTDWKIIVLSHHPIHWGNRAVQALLSMLDNYITGSSGNVVFDDINVNIPYNFNGKNDAKLISTFHGHTHNLISGVAGETNITRIGTPNACFGRNNEYGQTKYGYTETFVQKYGEVTVDENGVSTPIIYAKTANTAKDTAFCVYTIDFEKEKIYATCYGAGHDRELSYKPKVYYNIKNNLTNVTNNNTSNSIEENTSYTANLTVNTGYELESVIITMGGVDITNTAYTNGVINIVEVTGDIVITATAKAATQISYTITNTLTQITNNNNANSIEEGSTYTATLVPDEGRELRDDIVVTMGGVDITETAYVNGVINIPSVTGNITITGSSKRQGYEVDIASIGWTDGKRWSTGTGSLSNAEGHTAINLIEFERDEGEVALIHLYSTKDDAGNWLVDWKKDGNCTKVCYNASGVKISGGYLNVEETTNTQWGTQNFHNEDGTVTVRVFDPYGSGATTELTHGIKVAGYGKGENARIRVEYE
jgi:hypothetical protein